jgi:hypothetical protein
MRINLRGRSQDGSYPVIGSIDVGIPPAGVLILGTSEGSKYFQLQDEGGSWVYVEARVVDRNSEYVDWVKNESFWFA